MYEVFCDPGGFNTLRTDCTTGNNVGVIGGANTNSSILGGVAAAAPNNFINSDFSVILMGQNHLIDETSNNSFIGAGDTNRINGGCSGMPVMQGSEFSFIGGGNNNCIGSPATVVPPLPPVFNFGSPFSFIGGGSDNTIATDTTNISQFNVIGGGNNNIIFPDSQNNTIAGGQTNRITGYTSAIGGGGQNFIFASCGTIAGGHGSIINQAACGSFIGGGVQNETFACYATMPGGLQNKIYQQSEASFVGGESNTIANMLGSCLPSPRSFIGGGFLNCIDTDGTNNSCFNTIVAGTANCITSVVTEGFIGGGAANTVAGGSSFIGGGNGNRVVSGLPGGNVASSAIVGGRSNTISDNGTSDAVFSFLGGGTGNTVHGERSFLGGGTGNTVLSASSFIGGGGPNTLNLGADYSFIGGGQNNTVGNSSQFNFIGGGQTNTIDPSVSHSFIGGGDNNTVSGSCSAILGGDNNSDGGNNAVGIYGSGIVAPAVPGPSSMHVDELVLHNIPDFTGGPIGTYPTGSLYFCTIGGVNQVFVV